MKPIQKLILLSLLAFATVSSKEMDVDEAKKLPDSAKFVLVDDPKLGIDPPKEGRAEVGKTPARIKVVPGLADPKAVSLMSDRGVYLFHRDWKIWAEKRPDDARAKRIFDANATFRVAHQANGSVRFEANNRHGEFIVVEEDGMLSLSKPLEKPRIDFKIEK
jgi:hypothetical protein